jgi:AraC family transcriptional regulator, carnitine catabolism transcriptional activator
MPNWIIPNARSQSISIVLFDRFSNHGFANALEPLRAANTFLDRPAYRWRILTLDGGPVRTSAGVTIVPDGRFDTTAEGDALILLPSYGYQSFATPALSRTLRTASRRFARLIGLDGGAWLLAAAGLLDGRRATIHFDEFDAFAERFPEVRAERTRWVDDGDRLTASGAVTAFEMMMALIARTHGTALTLRIASLFSAADPAAPGPLAPKGGDRRVARAVSLMEDNVEHPLALPHLADLAGCSQREMETRFAAAFGATPRRVYAQIRLTAAHRLVTDTRLSIAEVAGRTGYDNASAFTRAFRRTFGDTPRDLRSR